MKYTALNEIKSKPDFESNRDLIARLRNELSDKLNKADTLKGKIKCANDFFNYLRSEGVEMYSWDYDGGEREVWGFDYMKESMGVVITIENNYENVKVEFQSKEDKY